MSNFKSEYITRQLDLIPVSELGKKITVIGAGAVGSHVVLNLARMGFGNITVYDFDTVSEENMNCQGYYIDQIGMKKVDALKDNVKRAIGFDIVTKDELYEDEALSGIVIMAVDSMKVRDQIFQACKHSADYIIDPRMGAEFAKMFVVRGNNEKDFTTYAKGFYTDDEAVREPCTAKSTIYCASLLSGLVVKVVKDIVTENKYTRIVNWSIKENAAEFHKVS